MEKIFFFLLMMAFICSCDNNSMQELKVEEQDVTDVRLKVVIVDEELNDRLNPVSPCFYGEEFINGISIFALKDGEKIELKLTEEIPSFVQPPTRWHERYGDMDQGALGYYFIDCSGTPANTDDYRYIRYADGNEDEIKIQKYKSNKESFVCIDKIWINKELAFERSPFDSEKETYYNPKNYPFLEPILDNDGNPNGNYVKPKNGTDILVIKK